jgi:hypothetical protein
MKVKYDRFQNSVNIPLTQSAYHQKGHHLKMNGVLL